MGIINSETNEELVKLNKTELEEKAKQMRAYELIALNAAGSGHSGGSLSITDITTALYFNIAKHDPKNPDWEARDRIIFSAGHKAPAQYAALGMAGYFPIEELMKLRKFGSNLQGHPHALKLKGLEVSTGSLGQGLSDAVGIALAGKIKKQDYKVFCIMGDGEQQEGQIWEAAMQASNHNLDNLIAIVDKNKLQIDGRVKEVSNIDPLDKKYEQLLIENTKKIIADEKIDAIIFEDYDKGSITEKIIFEIAKCANEKNIPTLVDPKKRNFFNYKGVTFFKPNFKELKEGTKSDFEKSDFDAIFKASKKLNESLNANYIITTLSNLGVFVYKNNGYEVIPAEIRQIADVSGAGDTVISVSSLCLASDIDIANVARIANLAGGLVCEKVGVVPINKEQLKEETIKYFDN